MSSYILSPLAEQDLYEIADYTIARFGVAQHDRYRDELEAIMTMLAQEPMLGVAVGYILPGMRKFPQGMHLVFYVQSDKGIQIVRILHQHKNIEEQDFKLD